MTDSPARSGATDETRMSVQTARTLIADLQRSRTWWRAEWHHKNAEAERLWRWLMIGLPIAFVAGDVLGWVLRGI